MIDRPYESPAVFAAVTSGFLHHGVVDRIGDTAVIVRVPDVEWIQRSQLIACLFGGRLDARLELRGSRARPQVEVAVADLALSLTCSMGMPLVDTPT